MTDQAITKADQERQAIEKANASIEQIIQECGLMALRGQPVLIQTITLAQGLSRLQAALPQGAVEKYFMPLAGTSLGFLTDAKPNEPYPWTVVRDCVIEAMLRGFRPIGNEMNIIAGRFYGAKNGYERIVREYPGMRDFRYDLGVPVMTPRGALVAYAATWLLAGEPMTMSGVEKDAAGMDTRIPVRVNQGMGDDGILGKATRKMFKRIYERITGLVVMDAEGDEVMPPKDLPGVAAPQLDGQRVKPAAAKNGTTKPADEAPEPGSAG